MSGRVDGKITLISGAGTGVGRACMVLFGREGAKVVGCSRTQANLDETLRLTKEAGGDGVVIAHDLAQPEGAEALIHAAMEAYGRIDILVNCASVGYSWLEKSPDSMGDVVNTTPEKWQEVMGINLDSYFYLCRGVIPIMQKQGGGAIVNVASISGFQGPPRRAHLHGGERGCDQPDALALCDLCQGQYPRELRGTGLHRHADGGARPQSLRRSGHGGPPHADAAPRHAGGGWPMAASISAPTRRPTVTAPC